MKKLQSQKPIVMAIGLDKKKNRERIIMGEREAVRSYLNGHPTNVLYDEERELGTFLVDHQRQLDKDWNEYVLFPLREAVKSRFVPKQQEISAFKFLDSKEDLCNPVSYFTAYMCKYWYSQSLKRPWDTNRDDLFEEKATLLTKSFKQELWSDKRYYPISTLWEKMQRIVALKGAKEDREAEIWYYSRKQHVEFVVVSSSFYPAILYNLSRLQELNYCFCQCSVCGRLFIAPSGHHNLCSDACKSRQSLQNKREFDARSRQHSFNRDAKNTTQRMRNRISSLRKHNAPEEQLKAAEAAFEEFKKEVISRKKEIKTEEDSKQFTEWLFEQERLMDELCSGNE